MRFPAWLFVVVLVTAVPAAALEQVADPAEARAEIERIAADCRAVDSGCRELAVLERYALRHPAPDVRGAALDELATLGYTALLPLAATVARVDEASDVRAAAVRVLAVWSHKALARETLATVAEHDPDPLVQMAARAALAERGVEPSRSGRFAYPEPGSPRIIYTPSAFLPEVGSFSATSYDVGHWSFGYGATDWLEATFQTSVPVGAIQLGPGLKFAYSPTEFVHLGLWVNSQFILPYVDDWFDRIILYGGGPTLSFGTRDAFVNVGCLAYGLSVGESRQRFVVMPMVGGSVRVSNLVKINLEVHVPMLGDGDGLYDEAGEIWGILYGVRLSGRRMYGDIAFLIPIFEDVGQLLKYIPIGFPMLSFGFVI